MGVRQAVVVIHGMGEQRPGDTLRQMSQAVIPPRPEPDRVKGIPRFISRPDKVTNGYDARRLLSPADGDRPQTEIYEYHWAHLLPGNTVKDLIPLMKRLMLRRFPSVPKRLRAIYLILWLLVLSFVGLVGVLWWNGTIAEWSVAETLAAIGVTGFALTVVLQLMKALSNWARGSFVDVARYLDRSPKNQKARDDIRRGAVELLTDLHLSGRYSRIIVMAHSLGSFVGYDAITYLWPRMNQAHLVSNEPRTKLDALEQSAADLKIAHLELREATLTRGTPIAPAEEALREAVAAYRAAQVVLWVEQRSRGNPWLVTDFVTVGSPQAHAQILLARNRDDLQRRIHVTEVPTSPPYRERKPDQGAIARFHYHDKVSDQAVVYHGAPFAVVRWSNIWFPGDKFAGPVAPTFGLGVLDSEAKPRGFAQRVPLLCHAKYFKKADETDKTGAGSVSLIRDALDLEASPWIVDTKDDKAAPAPTQRVWPPTD